MAEGDGSGLNRVIRLRAGAGEVRAAIEDDFHHFRVSVQHDGDRVTGVEADALRQPFSLCGAAGNRLEALVGEHLVHDTTLFFRHRDALLQCTHQFDLATLAIAMAARGTGVRKYHAFVEDQGEVGAARRAILRRDDLEILSWRFLDGVIEAPGRYSGRALGRGFTAWVGTSLGAELAEAALVLRRAVFISNGRGRTEELDRVPHAAPRGGCWVQQPERASLALRQKGTSLDFSQRPDLLTADDGQWLAFGEPDTASSTTMRDST
ncbi:hypothetical protein [Sphingopyxis macrogoltabida]|uniref:Uncharacterized protein n=1 Tax=Sphingopyxis macrogoltabida TaxID=33050 RepID=A0AAC9FHI8_SPHMC|nr:hypothetical protein [Sphingopyxis macrogoltabida]AMU92663.1 hypothetical protein ATM17_30870 [Sphingopyxis macrogoltabida]